MTYKFSEKPALIPPHGGYKKLLSYQMATIVYDFTVEFCRRYMSYKTNKTYTRTYDQMVQAARSGKQNITEGSQASGTSKKTELKLIGIARASLAELLDDCEDFLRQRKLKQWEKDDPRASEIRALAYRLDKSYRTYKTYIEEAETAANCLICLIYQTNYLLDRQLKALETEFLEKGGFTEGLYRERKRYRSYKSNKSYTTYKPRERGQALLELVIVMAVLVLLLVALVSLVILSLSTMQKSRLRARATSIAQDGIEDVRQLRDRYSNDWNVFVANGCDSIDSFDQSNIDGLFAKDARCTKDDPVAPTKVTTTILVTWDFGGRPYEVELETEFSQRQEGIFR